MDWAGSLFLLVSLASSVFAVPAKQGVIVTTTVYVKPLSSSEAVDEDVVTVYVDSPSTSEVIPEEVVTVFVDPPSSEIMNEDIVTVYVDPPSPSEASHESVATVLVKSTSSDTDCKGITKISFDPNHGGATAVDNNSPSTPVAQQGIVTVIPNNAGHVSILGAETVVINNPQPTAANNQQPAATREAPQPSQSSSCRDFYNDQRRNSTSQWKSAGADAKLRDSKRAFDDNLLYCDKCRTKSVEDYKKECGNLPEDCKDGLRDAAKDHFFLAALIYFQNNQPLSRSVCRIDEQCFDLPECDHFRDVGDFLILKALYNLFDYNQCVYNAIKDAELAARPNVGALSKIITRHAHKGNVEKAKLIDDILTAITTAAGMGGMLPEIAGAKTAGGRIVGGISGAASAISFVVFVAAHTIPAIIRDAAEASVDRENAKELSWGTVDLDLASLAKISKSTLRNMTDDLFSTGIANTAKRNFDMMDLIRDGRELEVKDTHREEVIDTVEKQLLRSLILMNTNDSSFIYFLRSYNVS